MRENVASTLSNNPISAQHMLSPATHRPWGAGTCHTYITPGFHCFSSSRLTVPLQEPERGLWLSRTQKEAAKLKRKAVKQHWRQMVSRGPAQLMLGLPPPLQHVWDVPQDQHSTDRLLQLLEDSEDGWSAESFPSFLIFLQLSIAFNDLKKAR